MNITPAAVQVARQRLEDAVSFLGDAHIMRLEGRLMDADRATARAIESIEEAQSILDDSEETESA